MLFVRAHDARPTIFLICCTLAREGLKPMTRTHIHFAPGLIGEEGVISGSSYVPHSQNSMLNQIGCAQGCGPSATSSYTSMCPKRCKVPLLF
jgi:hypothetical protein